jgi:flagellar hook-basal body complex protein FliE
MMIDAIDTGLSALSKTGLGGIDKTDDTASSLVGGAATVAGTAVAGPGFGAILGDMAKDAMQSLKAGESASIDGIQGKADTRQVVDSVMQADQTLKTAVALRDKLVSAYLDITKMQI